MENALQELIDIFKREKGYSRLFSLFIQKYKAMGRVEKSVSVTLLTPSLQETQALELFLAKDFYGKNAIRVTALQFEKAVQQTKFGTLLSDITMIEILEAYEGRKIVTNQEEKNSFEQEKDRFFNQLKTNTSSRSFQKFLDWVQREEKTKAQRYHKLYKEDTKKCRERFILLEKVCLSLPLSDFVFLPLFSSMMTHDPHAFDLNREEGKLLIHLFQVLRFFEQGIDILAVPNAEEINELLYDYRILKDDLKNAVTVYNFKGTNRNGVENFLLDGAVKEKSIFPIPLREVMKLRSLHPNNESKKVYIIENSSVSSHIVNHVIEKERDVSLVLGSGQLNTCTLRFLDLAVQSGANIYYSGDFDPEGLSIAQKLLNRYPKSLTLWHYEAKHYRKALSPIELTERRLNLLEHHIQHPDLTALKEEMKKEKKAGYQEKIIEEMLRNIGKTEE